MATTTATLTLTSADLTGDGLSLTATTSLYKAGTTIGLDQTTGLAKKIYSAAQSNVTLISAGSFDDNTAARIYVKNTGSSTTEFFTMELGSSNIVIGRLYGQDWLFIPYEGEQDLDISSTGTNMELEFMVVYQTA
tara:strand:- start:398 stop:802 length:405 start_codon:yes stop_codon:yes gene_type:complete